MLVVLKVLANSGVLVVELNAGPRHEYVKVLDEPGVTFAFMFKVAPAHTAGALNVTLGGAFTTTLRVEEAVHPPVPVTVAEYVPF